jgi:hypothetical protein
MLPDHRQARHLSAEYGVSTPFKTTPRPTKKARFPRNAPAWKGRTMAGENRNRTVEDRT